MTIKKDLKFQSAYVMKWSDLLEKLMRSEFNLNQLIKGSALEITGDMPKELRIELKEFLDMIPELYSETKSLEDIYQILESVEYTEKKAKFYEWIYRYVEAVTKPFKETEFITKLEDETFNKMTEFCFYNLILKNVGKDGIQKSGWDVEQMLVLRKVMYTFLDIIICDNLAKENALDNMKKHFGVGEKYCQIWYEFIEKNKEDLWKILIMKKYNRIERKLDQLLEKLELV